MATDAPIRMNTVPLRMTMTTDVLTLSQLLSPSFPVGAFAYSHGLETAITEGRIVSAPTLAVLVVDLVGTWWRAFGRRFVECSLWCG